MCGIRVFGAGRERVSATARAVFIIYVCEHVVMALKYSQIASPAYASHCFLAEDPYLYRTPTLTYHKEL